MLGTVPGWSQTHLSPKACCHFGAMNPRRRHLTSLGLSVLVMRWDPRHGRPTAEMHTQRAPPHTQPSARGGPSAMPRGARQLQKHTNSSQTETGLNFGFFTLLASYRPLQMTLLIHRHPSGNEKFTGLVLTINHPLVNTYIVSH